MRIRPFAYHTADTVKDALEMIGHYGPEARVLAGGTDLVPAIKHKESRPAHVVRLHKIKDLAFVDAKNGSIQRRFVGKSINHWWFRKKSAMLFNRHSCFRRNDSIFGFLQYC